MSDEMIEIIDLESRTKDRNGIYFPFPNNENRQTEHVRFERGDVNGSIDSYARVVFDSLYDEFSRKEPGADLKDLLQVILCLYLGGNVQINSTIIKYIERSILFIKEERVSMNIPEIKSVDHRYVSIVRENGKAKRMSIDISMAKKTKGGLSKRELLLFAKEILTYTIKRSKTSSIRSDTSESIRRGILKNASNELNHAIQKLKDEQERVPIPFGSIVNISYDSNAMIFPVSVVISITSLQMTHRS